VYSVYYALEIAVGRVVMSDGEGLENKGIIPDILCIPTSSDLRAEKDLCLEKTLELARSAGSTNAAPIAESR
jgi:C-terminal processing protease CtpA/Prc